jgi:hypothetical protein
MLVTACGDGRAREGGLERGGDEPSSEAEPARGGCRPSSEAEPVRGGVGPRARRSLLGGALDWATPAGCGGHHGAGRALGVCLSKRCSVLVFLQVLSRIPLVVFRGPSGMSSTLTTP